MDIKQEVIELKVYADQRVRLTKAVEILNTLIREARTDDEVVRLMGKREGVNLALSYVNEEIRMRRVRLDSAGQD